MILLVGLLEIIWKYFESDGIYFLQNVPNVCMHNFILKQGLCNLLKNSFNKHKQNVVKVKNAALKENCDICTKAATKTQDPCSSSPKGPFGLD